MNWNAKIVDKSEVDINGQVTYKFVCVGDGVELGAQRSETAVPNEIQQRVKDSVIAFAENYELAGAIAAGLEEQDNILVCIADE